MTRLLLAALLGAVHARAFAPWDAWWLQLLTLAGLFMLSVSRPLLQWHAPAEPRNGLVQDAGVRRTTPRPTAAFLLGLAFGSGHFLSGVYWIWISLHVYGLMPIVLASVATLLFCVGLALFPALGLALAAELTRRSRMARSMAVDAPVGLREAVLFGAAACVAEALRGHVFTGFPWLQSGYAHVDGPLRGYAPLLGVYGVSLIAAIVAACLGLLMRQGLLERRLHRPGAALGAGLLAAGAALSTIQWTDVAGTPIRVRLLQGNIAQSMKFDPGRIGESYRTYLDLVAQSPADVIVLPETALPLPWSQTPPEWRSQFVQAAGNARLLAGIPYDRPDPDRPGNRIFTNSVVALDSQGEVTQRYDKHHLVPFGEFIPPGFRWFVDQMQMPLGDFGRGLAVQPPFEAAGQRIAVNICYEDLFGEEIIQALPQATLLLNVSNIAWFGHSNALPQHLQISRMRALETGRPMLRATNTGMTAAIDARGKVVASLEPLSTGSLDITLSGRQGQTPYSRTGNAPALLLALGLLRVLAMPFRLTLMKR